MIHLVVFDLGRVLIRICDDWLHAAEVAGLDGYLPEADPISRAVLHELSTLCEIGAIDHDLFCQRVGRLFNVPACHIQKISDAYLCGPYPGAVELIDELHARGVKTACLSNTNANHWRLMTDPAGENGLPLAKLDYRFASHLANLRKPEDAIYAHVEQETQVAPEQILFFDDLPDNIAAAQTQGWEAVLVTDRDDPIGQIREALRAHAVL